MTGKLTLVFCLFVGLLATGCGKSGTLGDTIESQVRNVAPVFATGSAVAVKANLMDALVTSDGASGLWNVLRDYNNDTDNGRIDMSNMYKALYEYKNKVNDGEPSCEGKSFAAKAIKAPFTGFTTDYTYTCGYNDGSLDDKYATGFAMSRENGIINVLYGFQWAGNTDGGSQGVGQASYNENTKSLVFEMVNCVECGHTSAYSRFTVRTWIQGNPDTHNFEIKTCSGLKCYAGKGVSKGATNKMLFKYKGATPEYYCVPGNAAEATFTGLTAGLTNGSLDCTDLKSDVDVLYADLTGEFTTKMPQATTDFTNSTILLSL